MALEPRSVVDAHPWMFWRKLAIICISMTACGLFGCFLFQEKPATPLRPYWLPGTPRPERTIRPIRRYRRHRVERAPQPIPIPDLGPVYKKYRGRIVVSQRKLPKSKPRLMRALQYFSTSIIRHPRLLKNQWTLYYYAALRDLPRYRPDGPRSWHRPCDMYAFDVKKSLYKHVDTKSMSRDKYELQGSWTWLKMSGFRRGRQYQLRISAQIDPALDLSARNEILLAKSAIFTLR